ncbi:MAG: hypothetical protein KDD66_12535 [Bdellovibrionales bacterium]|nr:hypothetical protein [Bdellovibrionales bacterium]
MFRLHLLLAAVLCLAACSPQDSNSQQQPEATQTVTEEQSDPIAELLKECDAEERFLVVTISGKVDSSKHTELVALMREFTSVCEEWKANNSDYYRRFDDPGYPLERIAVTDSLRKKAESLGFEMNGVRRLDKMLSILLAGPSN